MSDCVCVDLGDRSYNIHIGSDLVINAGKMMSPLLRRPRVAIISDENVARLHLDLLKSAFTKEGIDSTSLVLPSGEASKSWSCLQQVVEWLISERVERDDIIIAFGGGVIGDLVGLAASLVRRGVRFVQIPTSLLAQVDSSVGGKTGINSSHGKNLIGVFAQPQMVLADVGLLNTLPHRDFIAGYGEVVKYALLGDGAFFEWLEKNANDMVKGDIAKRIYAVTRSCQMKADIVARDEKEYANRALLNLGHTFCHALEAATGYCDRLLHGEGVAIGLVLAFETSMRLGLCDKDIPNRVRRHFQSMGMKTNITDIEGPPFTTDELLHHMKQDKKVKDGKIVFIMARDIGQAVVDRDVNIEVVRAVLDDALI